MFPRRCPWSLAMNSTWFCLSWTSQLQYLVLVQTQSIEPPNSIHCTRHQNELSESTDRHLSRLSHVFPSSRMVVQEAGHRNALAPPTVQRAQIGCSSVEIAESLHRTSEPPAQVITHFMQGLCKPRPALAEQDRGTSTGLALRMPTPLRSRS